MASLGRAAPRFSVGWAGAARAVALSAESSIVDVLILSIVGVYSPCWVRRVMCMCVLKVGVEASRVQR